MVRQPQERFLLVGLLKLVAGKDIIPTLVGQLGDGVKGLLQFFSAQKPSITR